MKKNTFLIIATLMIFNFGLQSAAAQFNIKIPKINKPKVEQPKPSETSDRAERCENRIQNRSSSSQRASI